LPIQYRRIRNADAHEAAHQALTRDFDQFVSRVFGGHDVPPGLAPYAVDIREDAEHVYIEAELPGFTKDQIDVTIDKQILTITADRSETSDQTQTQTAGETVSAETTEQNEIIEPSNKPANQPSNEAEWLLRERRFHRFQRAFTMPDTIDSSAVNAKLENGMLSITLNKTPQSKPRKVTIG
ncbi:MAG TPA: Hsp20/alpha crystallin family protein, partial [Tepidisphaeraceae bacterium]|nr:Hsp20/alpha crystallin family protein [Tepidisphaeraceae bacterium]